MNALVVFLKYPEPGKVKTRLGKTIGMESAAKLYEIFVRGTFRLVEKVDVGRVFAAIDPPEKIGQFQKYIPGKVTVFPQAGDDLGKRMNHAIRYLCSVGAEKVAVLGTDSPTLPSEYLLRAFNILDTDDLVIGPAEDGGYYLIALKEPVDALFQNISWSSAEVLKSTIQYAQKLGLSYSLLPAWYDIDDLITLRRAAECKSGERILAYLMENPTLLSKLK